MHYYTLLYFYVCVRAASAFLRMKGWEWWHILFSYEASDGCVISTFSDIFFCHGTVCHGNRDFVITVSSAKISFCISTSCWNCNHIIQSFRFSCSTEEEVHTPMLIFKLRSRHQGIWRGDGIHLARLIPKALEETIYVTYKKALRKARAAYYTTLIEVRKNTPCCLFTTIARSTVSHSSVKTFYSCSS